MCRNNAKIARTTERVPLVSQTILTTGGFRGQASGQSHLQSTTRPLSTKILSRSPGSTSSLGNIPKSSSAASLKVSQAPAAIPVAAVSAAIPVAVPVAVPVAAVSAPVEKKVQPPPPRMASNSLKQKKVKVLFEFEAENINELSSMMQ